MNYTKIGKWAMIGIVGVMFAACTQEKASSDINPGFLLLPRGESSVTEQAAPVLGTDRVDAIAGQYIVVYKKSTDLKDVSKSMTRHLDPKNKPLFEYTSALKGFAARLSARELAALQSDPAVAYIEVDRTIQLVAVDSWGLDRIDQRDLPLDNTYSHGYANNGSGVHAYIIDTGINSSHSQFTGRISNGYDTVSNDTDPEDCHGHGSHVAGTVGGSTYGVAPGVTLHAVRVLNCQGSGTGSQVIGGIDWTKNDHSANPGRKSVANMSLGGGFSQSENDAVEAAIAAGIVFAVAAGNETTDACSKSPASAPSALTVAASDSSDNIASFSNYGSCVDIFAPGVGITSAWTGSSNSSNTINGTSMASPHVAGAAAIVLADGVAAGAVPGVLIADATACKINNPKGSPNLLLALIGDAAGGDPSTCGGGGGGYEFTESGSLSGSGVEAYHPSGSGGYYYSATSGTHVGHLEGPGSADFDLYLDKFQGNQWKQVASSLSYSSIEDISYSGTSGYYSWRVKSYSGSGSYTMSWNDP